ncbi:hypothetical protein F5Y16DRAFT_418721 [Xylariaceae sp. FL0255]|nr:hypothetical protein F5Y16DRAFT_418721 [Xylariaceae sp. FL0255]
MLVKLILLLLYLRMFSPSKRFKILTEAGMALVLIFSILTILTNLGLCRPLSKAPPVGDIGWAKKVGNSTCFPAIYGDNSSIGFFTTVSDMCIMLVPISPLVELQVSRSGKLEFSRIFLIGVLYGAVYDDFQSTRSGFMLTSAPVRFSPQWAALLFAFTGKAFEAD